MIWGAVDVLIRGQRVGIVIGADRLSDLDAAAEIISTPAPRGARWGFVLGDDLQTAIRRAHAMSAREHAAYGGMQQLISDAAEAVETIDADELERFAAEKKR